jgi:hypothetical protein
MYCLTAETIADSIWPVPGTSKRKNIMSFFKLSSGNAENPYRNLATRNFLALGN